MSPAVKCLLLLLVVAILFITEIIPLAVTAMGASVACWILGLIPEKQIFLGLADSTVVLFAGMFVVGAAMFHTGVAQKIGAKVVRVCGTSENRLMLGLMLVAAVMSAFLSNTGTTACLIPVVMSICATAKISPSRQLMPLAFAAALGGTCTLIGTPPNMLANVALKAAGMPELQFGFFEYAYIGIPITVAGILYMMLIGKHLLPNNLATDVDELEFAEDDAAAISHKASRQIICGIILVGVIVCMGLDVVPLHIVSVIGALLCVLTGCLTEKQAYDSIDWITIFLFAGMIPVAEAMNTSGAGKLLAAETIKFMGGSPSPYLVTAVLFILAAVLTQFMSNTASKALLCPVGIALAQQLGASPRAVLMAILIASSCAFASPVGTPPNTLVLGPGHYRFLDYIKCGFGLIVVCLIVSIIVIPIVWPFFPGK
ncbi:MAG: SLC13/DASS family transporter [Acidaminococcaceae bacterium]|nr:SLC13/DASS family transporter [Acidaminococcaceae bacterium]MCI2098438.1 SLC13 family permease [Succiniclasticum sp.]MDY6302777.1 SLC13 family permease [Succiniclasticum sp.]HCJ90499.1 transporter [Acidaminococcaceae bacterium]